MIALVDSEKFQVFVESKPVDTVIVLFPSLVPKVISILVRILPSGAVTTKLLPE